MKRIAFFPAHPSQLWLMHALSSEAPDFFKIFWFLRDKDILLDVAEELNINFKILSKTGIGIVSNGFEFLNNIKNCIYYSQKYNIDLWLTKYGAGNIAARILNKPNISFNDDDADIVPFIAATSYPFADIVLTPRWTRMSGYENKTLRYDSFHELFYLHPKRFIPDHSLINKYLGNSYRPYIFIRLSRLAAHHDIGIRGISDNILDRIISSLTHQYRILISSERPLKNKYKKYAIAFPFDKIHHLLAFSSLLISDSQTMSAESALLGIPSIRINDFVGRISYLKEIEDNGLSFGIRPEPSQTEKIFSTINFCLKQKASVFLELRNRFLDKLIDPVPFFWDQIVSLI